MRSFRGVVWGAGARGFLGFVMVGGGCMLWIRCSF